MLEDCSVRMPSWIQDRFPPDQRAAVDFLRQLIDVDMLKKIAEADYERDTEEHLAALIPLWKGANLTELGPWFPREVLELIRWSEPEVDEWKPGSTGSRGHIMRAFSCAVLLASPDFEPDKETLIQMLDSVIVLSPDAQEATARFLVWRLGSLEHEEDRPFFALGLSAIILYLKEILPVRREQDLANWLADVEASERAYLAKFHKSYQSSPWLFGLSFSDMRNDRWEHLIRNVKEMSGDNPLGRMLSENHTEFRLARFPPLP